MSSPGPDDRDHVLDATEHLVAQDGIDAVTIRALTRATCVSNGAIYRTYQSRGGLLGRAWIRAERRFLDLLGTLIDEARRNGSDALGAVCAAAETSLLYPELFPGSSALLMTVRRQEVVGQVMPVEIAEQLEASEAELAQVMSHLAASLWERTDSDAVDLVATCIIDLPKWIVLRGRPHSTPIVRDYLRAAVRSVLEVGPPPAGLALVASGIARDGAA